MLLKINGLPVDPAFVPNLDINAVQLHSIPMPTDVSGPIHWITHLRIIETVKEMSQMDFGGAFLIMLGGIALWAVVESLMRRKKVVDYINGFIRITMFLAATEMILRAFDSFRNILHL